MLKGPGSLGLCLSLAPTAVCVGGGGWLKVWGCARSTCYCLVMWAQQLRFVMC